MNKLPNEIIHEILDFTYTCDKEKNYILNNNFYNIRKTKCKKCKFIKLLHKQLCNQCEIQKVIRARLIINNLLPS
jgi:hypothetical protein